MTGANGNILPIYKTYSEKDIKLAATLAWIERLKRDTMPDHNDIREFNQWFKEEIIDKF